MSQKTTITSGNASKEEKINFLHLRRSKTSLIKQIRMSLALQVSKVTSDSRLVSLVMICNLVKVNTKAKL